MHDLSESDANRVISRLSTQDVGAEKIPQADGRWAIAVPREKAVVALAFLDANRVLHPRSESVPTSSKRSLVPGRDEQRFQYERSVALSIEGSLSAIQGVLEARVHLNLPETDPLFGARKEESGSGSVLLIIDSRFSGQDGDIAALVGGAAGIPTAKVSVLRSSSLPQAVIAPSPVTSQNGEGVPTPNIAQSRQSLHVGAWSARADVGVVSIVALFALGVFGMIRRRRRGNIKFSLPENARSDET